MNKLRLRTSILACLILLGSFSFTQRSQALTQDEIDRLSFSMNQLGTLSPNLLGQIAAFEGVNEAQMDAFLKQFAQELYKDAFLQQQSTSGQALTEFFYYFHTLSFPSNPSNYNNDVTGYLDNVLIATVIAAYVGQVKAAYLQYRKAINLQILSLQTIDAIRTMNRYLMSNFLTQPQSAGEISPAAFLENAQFTLSGSYASISDGLLRGSGSDYDVTLSGIASYDETWLYGFNFTASKYELDSTPEVDSENYMLDLFLSKEIYEGISVGGFFNFSHNDIDEQTTNIFGTPVTFGGSQERIGAGVFVGAQHQVQDWTLGAITSIASMNKASIGDLFDDTDTMWITQISAHRPIYDRLSGELYGSWITMFSNESGTDHNYGVVGVEFDYPITEKVILTAGFEKGVLQDKYEDNRVTGSLTYIW